MTVISSDDWQPLTGAVLVLLFWSLLFATTLRPPCSRPPPSRSWLPGPSSRCVFHLRRMPRSLRCAASSLRYSLGTAIDQPSSRFKPPGSRT
ncbi:hypothetical protein DFH06DRAFT_1439200 [Mycena polygramma]|nr:hypothetical protein DFH06DRAFT_1439200 [Mycena polygramma]